LNAIVVALAKEPLVRNHQYSTKPRQPTSSMCFGVPVWFTFLRIQPVASLNV